ncbi:hypothetical protein B0H63DRAFT_560821 [Podospora didyma]|uniref:Uncharacterized protein n=1 Tax=Podospora didyma TaxID=330526 RepID=A0AAE0NGD2_9PEZI|nr:hypothetical protein B0H63DRAFT_560821 [Podospora didyma]
MSRVLTKVTAQGKKMASAPQSQDKSAEFVAGKLGNFSAVVFRITSNTLPARGYELDTWKIAQAHSASDTPFPPAPFPDNCHSYEAGRMHDFGPRPGPGNASAADISSAMGALVLTGSGVGSTGRSQVDAVDFHVYHYRDPRPEHEEFVQLLLGNLPNVRHLRVGVRPVDVCALYPWHRVAVDVGGGFGGAFGGGVGAGVGTGAGVEFNERLPNHPAQALVQGLALWSGRNARCESVHRVKEYSPSSQRVHHRHRISFLEVLQGAGGVHMPGYGGEDTLVCCTSCTSQNAVQKFHSMHANMLRFGQGEAVTLHTPDEDDN